MLGTRDLSRVVPRGIIARGRPGMSDPNPACAGKLQLTLLGGFEVRASTGTALRLPTRKTQALVAYLALETQAKHARAKLAALLWGEVPDQQAGYSLRHALSEIRRVLGPIAPEALVTSGD